jgi:hypothetical protein
MPQKSQPLAQTEAGATVQAAMRPVIWTFSVVAPVCPERWQFPISALAPVLGSLKICLMWAEELVDAGQGQGRRQRGEVGDLARGDLPWDRKRWRWPRRPIPISRVNWPMRFSNPTP